MGTADDPGLLLIGKEVLLPLRALEGDSRLKKASDVSQRSEARGSAVFFLCTDSHCSLMEAQNGSKNKYLSV